MRIAVLCPGYGWVTRGIEVLLQELMQRLIALDESYRFEVYTMAEAGQEEERIRLHHVPAISRYHYLARLYAQVGHHLRFYLRPPANFESLSFNIMTAPRLLFRKYDLVLNLSAPWGGWVCQLKRALDRTPFLHTAHGGTPTKLEVICAGQKPDVYVALSEPDFEWARQEFPWLSVVLIPNGVDTERFSPWAGVVDTHLCRPLVLFVGALEPMKRPDLAINAVACLDQASLLMIGDGPQRLDMEQLGQELLGEKRFLLISHVPNSEMPQYYNACDVFTLPSPQEPFGIVFLEAMACGKPVVANDAPVQKWIIQEAGLLCDCLDAGEYAETLRKALGTDFGNAPLKRARDFDWDVIARKYDKVVRDAVRCSQTAGR